MKKIIFLLVCLGMVLCFAAGCKKPPPPSPNYVKTGGRELASSGVKFLVPWEEGAGHSDSPGGIMYESTTMRVTWGNGVLYVNATNYGAVKAGDVVNLLNPGRVFVNDQERQQQK
jgi:hypothetical protein